MAGNTRAAGHTNKRICIATSAIMPYSTQKAGYWSKKT